MNTYSYFNLSFTIVVIAISLICKTSKNSHIISLKIATIFILLGFPWDYFAIKNNAWHYPKDPGITLYGVPFNDLWFVFVASYLSCVIFQKRSNNPSKNH